MKKGLVRDESLSKGRFQVMFWPDKVQLASASKSFKQPEKKVCDGYRLGYGVDGQSDFRWAS
jgi:hypothetical protein